LHGAVEDDGQVLERAGGLDGGALTPGAECECSDVLGGHGKRRVDFLPGVRGVAHPVVGTSQSEVRARVVGPSKRSLEVDQRCRGVACGKLDVTFQERDLDLDGIVRIAWFHRREHFFRTVEVARLRGLRGDCDVAIRDDPVRGQL